MAKKAMSKIWRVIRSAEFQWTTAVVLVSGLMAHSIDCLIGLANDQHTSYNIIVGLLGFVASGMLSMALFWNLVFYVYMLWYTMWQGLMRNVKKIRFWG